MLCNYVAPQSIWFLVGEHYEGRSGVALVAWLQERTPQFRESVTYVVIDHHCRLVSRRSVRPELLPTPSSWSMTWELHDRRGRNIDPQWADRRRLLIVRERLLGKSFAKMWDRISAADPSAQSLSVWSAQGELRTLLSSVPRRRAPAWPTTIDSCAPESQRCRSPRTARRDLEYHHDQRPVSRSRRGLLHFHSP